jgi:hypothetical protein
MGKRRQTTSHYRNRQHIQRDAEGNAICPFRNFHHKYRLTPYTYIYQTNQYIDAPQRPSETWPKRKETREWPVFLTAPTILKTKLLQNGRISRKPEEEVVDKKVIDETGVDEIKTKLFY